MPLDKTQSRPEMAPPPRARSPRRLANKPAAPVDEIGRAARKRLKAGGKVHGDDTPPRPDRRRRIAPADHDDATPRRALGGFLPTGATPPHGSGVPDLSVSIVPQGTTATRAANILGNYGSTQTSSGGGSGVNASDIQLATEMFRRGGGIHGGSHKKGGGKERRS